VPKAAAIPQEAKSSLDEEPTEFYDSEKTRAAPADHAQRIFDEEPTGFYDADKAKPPPLAAPRTISEEPTSAFEDEPTQFLVGDEDELEIGPAIAAAAQRGTGGFDEEPTEIFFNKEDGVGIQELIEEINEIEPDGPLNKPIIAPDLLAEPLAQPPAPPIAVQPRFPTPGRMPVPAGLPRNTPPPMPVPPGLLQRNTPSPMQVPPGLAQRNTPPPIQVPPGLAQRNTPPPMMRRNTPAPMQAPGHIRRNTPTPIQAPAPRVGSPTLEIQMPRKRSSSWPTAAGVVVVLLAIMALIWKTPVGVAIGLRAPETGAIEVRTAPEVSADVLLDGVFRGHAPLRIGGVHAGTRRLTVQATGYLPVAKEITIRGGSTLPIDLTLVPDAPPPPPEPPKVEQPAPTTTEKPRDRDPYARKRDTPHATDGTPAAPAAPSIAAAPKPSGGTLVVNTVPWSLVFIDGRDTGRNTPLLGYPISAGAHELRLQTANGQVHVEHLEVQPGQTVSVTRRF
jgi:serine/threonine-protein kinase